MTLQESEKILNDLSEGQLNELTCVVFGTYPMKLTDKQKIKAAEYHIMSLYECQHDWVQVSIDMDFRCRKCGDGI